jgi:hypothetical protein
MQQIKSLRRCSIAVALAAALLAWPAAGYAQLGGLLPRPPNTTTGTVIGNASAIQATILGITTTLTGTGPVGSNDAQDASLLTGGLPSTLTAEALSATAISYADEVDSAASLGNLSWAPTLHVHRVVAEAATSSCISPIRQPPGASVVRAPACSHPYQCRARPLDPVPHTRWRGFRSQTRHLDRTTKRPEQLP